MSKEISRRDFLKLAGLGTTGFLVSGCAIENRAISTEKAPKLPTGIALPPTKLAPTKPTPTETKEAKQGILWTLELLFSSKKREAFFTNQDKLFLATPEGYPAAFNLATGKKLWQWEERGIVYGAEPETVYMVRSDKRLYALDTQTGQTKWKVVPGASDSIEVSFPMMIGKQTVHLRFEDKGYCLGCSSFLSIDKKTGQILWWENSPNRSFFKYYIQSESTIIIVPYGYASAQDYVRGVDPTTGREKWALEEGVFPFPGDIGHVDALANIRKAHFTEDRLFCRRRIKTGSGTTDDTSVITAIDLDSGKEIWRSESKGKNQYEPSYEEVISVSPTAVYALCSTGFRQESTWLLIALDRQTGEELWLGPDMHHVWAQMREVSGWDLVGEIEGTAILSNENLGYTHGIDVASGKERWENDDLRISHLVGISKNTLIAEYNNPDSSPPFLFGLDPATGGRKWRLELSQVTHEAIIFHDKVIYGNGRALTVLDPETGALLSTIPLSDQPTRLVPQKDFLLAQSKGNLSAVLV